MAELLQNVTLLDLIPPNLRSDTKVQAAAAALDVELQSVTAAIQESLHLPRVDELPEQVLDLLAWQWHVDFYEPVGISVETKRKLIKSAIKWHRTKGTPAVIEEVTNAIYEPSEVVEWFDYGGKPYHFKIRTEEIGPTPEQRSLFVKAVASVKNTRSWLEAIEYVIRLSEILVPADDFAASVQFDQIDSYRLRGRSFDGGWHYVGPVTFDGAWRLGGDRLHDGAVPGDEDSITPGLRFDFQWKFDGLHNFYPASQTKKVLFCSVEPDDVFLSPGLMQKDMYSILFPLDSTSRKLDGGFKLGPVPGAQDDCWAGATLVNHDDIDPNDTAMLQTEIPLRENYPLPRMQYFDGAWAFGWSISLNGSEWYNSGLMSDGLPGRPDPSVKPSLMDGCAQFAGGLTLGAPMPVVTFGSDADSADFVSTVAVSCNSDYVDQAETTEIKTVLGNVDFAYGDRRFDGGFSFAAPSFFDGFWLLGGGRTHNGIPASRAKTMDEPAPLRGAFDGSMLFNGGATSFYDGNNKFSDYPVDSDVVAFDGRLLGDAGELSPVIMIRDDISGALRIDGTWMLDGVNYYNEASFAQEQEKDEITIGRWFNGGWNFDAGNKIYLDGTRGLLDGSFFHTLLGECRNHFDGSLALDGSDVFWKGGETFEHYRYEAS